MEWLLEMDVDRHATYDVGDGYLKNAYSFAVERGQTAITEILEAAGCRPPDEQTAQEEEAEETGDKDGSERSRSHALIIKHFCDIFGSVEPLSLNEIFPVMAEGPDVSVHVVPSAKGIFLFTTGMSDQPMDVPEGMEEYQYAELMMQIPADWPIPRDLKAADDSARWPFQWLRDLAYMPHENQTWLRSIYTVVSSDDPPVPLGPNTKQSCFLLVTSPDSMCNVTLPGKICKIYRVLPIYTEERDVLLSDGMGALWQRLTSGGVGYTVDLYRPNVAM